MSFFIGGGGRVGVKIIAESASDLGFIQIAVLWKVFYKSGGTGMLTVSMLKPAI